MQIPNRWGAVLLLVLVCIVSVTYLTIALGTDLKHPAAPLDDVYITFQYARQIAQGQPYQYNEGDPPTTGMTSPLFGFLGSLGFRGESRRP